MKLLATCAIIAIAAVSQTIQAQTVTIFQSGFEPGEGYSVGNLAGQSGWFTFLGESPNFGQVTNVNPLNGAQSILLDGQQIALGSFHNYAAIGHAVTIAPSMGGTSLRYIEVTGRCAIVDPTIEPGHHSVGWFAQYRTDEFISALGAGSRNGELLFGWPAAKSAAVAPIQSGTAVTFRHVVDYYSGFAALWMNGQPVFQHFAEGFTPPFIANEVFFEGVSVDDLPFDTQVWFDDIQMKAVYALCPGDTNSDIAANVDDLLAVITAWGDCPAAPATCPANIVNTGASFNKVDVDDLLTVITNWGPCGQ